MINKIKLYDKEVDVIITVKNNKNTYLRVKNGKIFITTNKYVKEKSLVDLIENNKKNIYEQICLATDSLSTTYYLEDKKKILLFGKYYDLVVNKGTKFEYDINNNVVNLYIRSNQNIAKCVDKIIFNEINLRINALSKEIEKKLLKYKFKSSKFSVKKMTSRWGSCNTFDRSININFYLGLLDVDMLDYVLHHEYAHMKYANHSKDYWNFVESIYPNYKIIRQKLKKIKI